MVAFAAATAAFIFLRRERQALVTDLRAEGVVLLNTIEAAAGDLVYRLEVDGLQQIMDSIGQHPVVSGRIYDAQGRIIADATESQTHFRIEPDPFGQRTRRGKRVTVAVPMQSDFL